jgi:prepilin-type N-terminal cleavage/methylation domain-containing protein
MLKKAKKGFSLIELLVVIAIIGILSAVGITAYSGYTADAKEQSTRAMHANMIALVNAEMAKCSQGAGNWAWQTTGDADIACTTAISQVPIVNYANTVLGMKNPHSVDTVGLIGVANLAAMPASADQVMGAVYIYVTGTTTATATVSFSTVVASGTTITAVVKPY